MKLYKSLDDSAKQLVSVNAVIISLYIAIIINSQSFEAIRVVTNGNPFGETSTFFVWVFLLAPIGLWFLSIIYCVRVLEPSIKSADLYLNVDTPDQDDLEIIVDKKFGPLKSAYSFMILGLAVIFLLMIVIITYQLIGSAAHWKQIGDDYFASANYEEANIAYDKSIELNPND
jgi:hypothetical protein